MSLIFLNLIFAAAPLEPPPTRYISNEVSYLIRQDCAKSVNSEYFFKFTLFAIYDNRLKKWVSKKTRVEGINSVIEIGKNGRTKDGRRVLPIIAEERKRMKKENLKLKLVPFRVTMATRRCVFWLVSNKKIGESVWTAQSNSKKVLTSFITVNALAYFDIDFELSFHFRRGLGFRLLKFSKTFQNSVEETFGLGVSPDGYFSSTSTEKFYKAELNARPRKVFVQGFLVSFFPEVILIGSRRNLAYFKPIGE